MRYRRILRGLYTVYEAFTDISRTSGTSPIVRSSAPRRRGKSPSPRNEPTSIFHSLGASDAFSHFLILLFASLAAALAQAPLQSLSRLS